MIGRSHASPLQLRLYASLLNSLSLKTQIRSRPFSTSKRVNCAWIHCVGVDLSRLRPSATAQKMPAGAGSDLGTVRLHPSSGIHAGPSPHLSARTTENIGLNTRDSRLWNEDIAEPHPTRRHLRCCSALTLRRPHDGDLSPNAPPLEAQPWMQLYRHTTSSRWHA